MQFREQAKKIQCIRATYDPVTKMSPQKVVVSFNRYAAVIPSEVFEALTEAERGQLRAFFDEKQERQKAASAKGVVHYVSSSISQAAAAVAGEVPVTEAEANSMWAAMAELSKALKKAGHLKPAKPAAAAPAVAPGQQSLIEPTPPAAA